MHLFRQSPMRRFALIDAEGRCRALRQSHKAPAGTGWVEVEDLLPSRLNRPLAEPRRP